MKYCTSTTVTTVLTIGTLVSCVPPAIAAVWGEKMIDMYCPNEGALDCRGDYRGVVKCVDHKWVAENGKDDHTGWCDPITPPEKTMRASSCWGDKCLDGIPPPQGRPEKCTREQDGKIFIDKSGKHWWTCEPKTHEGSAKAGRSPPRLVGDHCDINTGTLKEDRGKWVDKQPKDALCKKEA